MLTGRFNVILAFCCYPRSLWQKLKGIDTKRCCLIWPWHPRMSEASRTWLNWNLETRRAFVLLLNGACPTQEVPKTCYCTCHRLTNLDRCEILWAAPLIRWSTWFMLFKHWSILWSIELEVVGTSSASAIFVFQALMLECTWGPSCRAPPTSNSSNEDCVSCTCLSAQVVGETFFCGGVRGRVL